MLDDVGCTSGIFNHFQRSFSRLRQVGLIAID